LSGILNLRSLAGCNSAASMIANIGHQRVWRSMPGAAQSFNLHSL